MKPSLLRLCILGSLAIAVGVFAAHARTRAQQYQELASLVPQPADWVAFQADVTVTHADSGVRIEGRFMRASDGSTRLETGQERDEPRIISINNLQLVRHYVMRLDGSWVSSPLGVASADEVRPIQYRTDTPHFVKYPKRLALMQGQNGSLNASEGLVAYQYVNGTFTQHFLVPELNMFSVVRNRPDGRREIYNGIRLEEPPSELFQPPAGAVVTMSDRPAGIFRETVG